MQNTAFNPENFSHLVQTNNLSIIKDDSPTGIPDVSVGIVYKVVPPMANALNGTLKEKHS